MKLKISNKIFQKFPKLNIAIVIAKGIDNTGSDDKIYHLLDEVSNLIKMDFVPEEIAKHPLISSWRLAYSEFGVKPSKYHNSVESLMKRILKDEEMPKINKAVDVYNYLSLKHKMPMGADDLNKVEGDIELTKSNGNEIFIPLNSDEVQNPEEGEVIYKDGKNVLCRRWNWRECDKTKVTENSKNLILYVEGLPPLTKEKVLTAANELADLIKMFCGGETEVKSLDIANPEVEI